MKKQDFKVLKTTNLYPFTDNPFNVVEDEMLSELSKREKLADGVEYIPASGTSRYCTACAKKIRREKDSVY